MSRAIEIMRLERGASHLHRLGPRCMFEFLLTIASRHGILSDVVDELEDMRALDPDTVRGGGGHEIPARVLRIVPRS